jgi:hypothetical protein
VPGPAPEKTVALAESGASPDAGEAVVASESTNVWPDEAAEVAFFAESRVRGEPAEVGAGAAPEAAEEIDTRGLPPLDELVKRIPPEVRETLDDLFRVKFTGVKRVPQKALKG